MEFFDKKQDVIDIQLTQFGRYLLSRGLFSPEYYTFHDDGILYNSTMAGFSEEQNKSEDRINEAPTIQPQASYYSLEKEFETTYKKILSGKGKAGDQEFQPSAIKDYAFAAPIGTSDINKDYAPAWQIDFLKGVLTGSVGHIELSERSGGRNILKIPQIESQILVEYMDASNIASDHTIDLQSNLGILTDEEDMILLLRLGEENTPFQKENFDIEVYEIQEEQKDDGTFVETLRPLSFIHEHDETRFGLNQISPENDPTYVQHYFDMLSDEEIDDALLCKYDPVQTKKGVFADHRTKICQDILDPDDRQTFDIYTDETDTPDEVC